MLFEAIKDGLLMLKIEEKLCGLRYGLANEAVEVFDKLFIQLFQDEKCFFQRFILSNA